MFGTPTDPLFLFRKDDWSKLARKEETEKRAFILREFLTPSSD